MRPSSYYRVLVLSQKASMPKITSFFWNKVWFTGSSRFSTGEGRPTNLFLIFLTPSSHYTNTTEIIKCPVRMNRLADREDLVFFSVPSSPRRVWWSFIDWRCRKPHCIWRGFSVIVQIKKERERKSHNPNSRLPDCAEHIRLKAVGAPTRLVPAGTAKRLRTLELRIGHRWSRV